GGGQRGEGLVGETVLLQRARNGGLARGDDDERLLCLAYHVLGALRHEHAVAGGDAHDAETGEIAHTERQGGELLVDARGRAERDRLQALLDRRAVVAGGRGRRLHRHEGGGLAVGRHQDPLVEDGGTLLLRALDEESLDVLAEGE